MKARKNDGDKSRDGLICSSYLSVKGLRWIPGRIYVLTSRGHLSSITKKKYARTVPLNHPN